jgi:heme-degrading monooxygenase HmoA
MNFVLITHEVDDYSVWKVGFDEASGLRKQAGEIEFQVLRLEDDPNTVIHFSRWQSLEQARNFFESDNVKEIRENLGVKDPEFTYLCQLENGVL